MIAKIEEDGLKIFARALKFLSGIGNDIYFEAKAQGLILKVVNSSKTSFCSITLHNGFFGSYQLAGPGKDESHCSVPARPLLHILKSIKNMKNCNIHLDPQKEVLVINTQMPKNIEFINSIKILENEQLECPGQSKSLNNTLICHSKVFAVLLQCFNKNLKELSLDITSTQIEISNHINHCDKDVQTVRLSYKFEKKEFIEYEVSVATKLIVLSKDFLSSIELADSSGGELKIAFSKNGRPLTVTIGTDPVIQVEMVLASLREDTLKTLAKPPEASSYKELMGGYLDGHTSKNQDESESIFTDTSLIRAISPSVASYGQGRLSEQFKGQTKKRKSTESIKDDASSAIGAVSELRDEPSKKQKINETLTQDEEREVSQIIESLAGLQDDEEDCIELLNSQPKQQIESNMSIAEPHFNSVLGHEAGIGRGQTLLDTETNSDSASFRFDIGRAQLPSECYLDTRRPFALQLNNQPSKDNHNLKTSSQIARNVQSNKNHGKWLLDMDRVRKKMPKRAIHAPDSDPERDDDENISSKM